MSDSSVRCILIPTKDGRYIVTNTGRHPFWPHDGDSISKDKIPWLMNEKGWVVIIKHDKRNYNE